MRKKHGTADFRAAQKNGFDFDHDYALVVSSFLSAYGLRIRAAETRIPWPEFLDLLNGLPGDTPLIQLAGIRTMDDKEAENIPEEAQKARSDWFLWLSEQENAGGQHDAATLEGLFRNFCS